MYNFKYVYKKVNKRDEELKYKLINTDVELDEKYVESLERSSMAKIKYRSGYKELYYNI